MRLKGTVKWQWLACLLAVGWLLLPRPGHAIQIDVYPPVPRPGSVIRLDITGTWPNSCVPEIDHAAAGDGRFRVYAKALGVNCKDEPTPFQLETLLGHWMYTLMAVSGFYPVEFYVQTLPEAPPHLYAFNVIRASPFSPTGPMESRCGILPRARWKMAFFGPIITRLPVVLRYTRWVTARDRYTGWGA